LELLGSAAAGAATPRVAATAPTKIAAAAARRSGEIEFISITVPLSGLTV
jgi:hypothetical protein